MEKRRYANHMLSLVLEAELGRPPTKKEYNSRYRKERYKNDAVYRQRVIRAVKEYQARKGGHRYITHKLTAAQVQRMREAQGDRCAICRGEWTGAGPQVDHAHATGTIRALLCVRCNVGLGCFKDDIKRLSSAIAYLELCAVHEKAIAQP